MFVILMSRWKPFANIHAAGSYSTDFGKEPRVIVVEFPSLSLGSERVQQLSDHGTWGGNNTLEEDTDGYV